MGLANFIVSIGGDADPLVKELRRAERDLRTWGKTTQENFAKVGEAAEALSTLIGVSLAGGMAELVKQSLESVSALADQAEALGMNVEKLQALRFAAGQAGVEQEQLTTSLEKLSVKIGEAASGSQDAQNAFVKWSIAYKDFRGNALETNEVIANIAERMRSIKDPALQAALSSELFGKKSMGMINMLRDGSDGLAEMENKARDLGAVLSEDVVQKGKKAGDELKAMGDVVSANLNAAIVDILPNLKTFKFMLEGIGAAAHGFANLWDGLKPSNERSTERLIDDLTRINNEISILETRRKTLMQNPDGIDVLVDKNYTQKRLSELQMQSAVLNAMLTERTSKMPSIDIEKPASVGGFKPKNMDAQKGADALDDYLKKLQQEHDLLGLTERDKVMQKAVIEAESIARRNHISITEEYINKVREAAAANYDQEQAIKNVQQASAEMSSAVSSSFSDLIKGTKSFTDVLGDLVGKIEDVFAKALLEKPLENMLTNFIGGSTGGGGLLTSIFGGFRAEGGPVTGGVPYVVGEKGPELMVPSVSGTIMSNASLRGGTAANNNFNINVNVSGSGAGNPSNAAATGKAIADVVKGHVIDVIRQQQRPGGYLYK